MRYSNGLTIRDLKIIINRIPNKASNGEDNEVWMLSDSKPNLSSQVKTVERLNENDLILGVI